MNLKTFLSEYKVSPKAVDCSQLINCFLSEMEAGLMKKASSLCMFESKLSPTNEALPDENILVIDAGGTNLRTCLVNVHTKTISEFERVPMPAIEREYSSDEFFNYFANATERLINKADKIGFCFSYGVKILDNHDGIPIMFSKEIKAHEVLGKEISKELFIKLSERGYDVSKKQSVVLNDTVATLLAAVPESIERKCVSCIGFILGTGTNTAYVDKNYNNQVINIESGNLAYICSDIDQNFINQTENPNQYYFEKQIGGAYIGKLSLFYVKQAAKCNLFSSKASSLIEKQVDMTTIELSNYLENKTGPYAQLVKCKKDERILTSILKSFIKRTAILVACNLASTVIKACPDSDGPVLINADGSTFYKTRYLKKYTEKYLRTILRGYGKKAVLTCINDSPEIGSAVSCFCTGENKIIH